VGDFLAAQKTLNLEIKETYHKLETLLAKNKCRIIAEAKPSGVSVIQGSLWGTSPQAAQKRTTYSLAQDTKETSITATSKLTKGYINLTVIGCVFSLVLLAVCVWMALNLQLYVAVGEAGFWGWLAQIGGYIDMDKAAIFIQLTWILSAFLAATLIVEAFIVWKVYSKIDVFSQEILNALEQ
jgi:hypothetical protein